jgi:hypothetical protein
LRSRLQHRVFHDDGLVLRNLHLREVDRAGNRFDIGATARFEPDSIVVHDNHD